ncbi:hypothetical protein LAV84_29635 [Rhizobium sp. VS19-DR104.2]|uniref:hypothetical protein n=1 Tax=unclassified Rhizobium TaxID=2613769 RepID=UPI001ADA74C1|nr:MULTISPECIES: hypothetical protein [unclassified Rhizobium]MBO9102144.1 hypothetical protein [Rhizobium sp. L58/93]MBO9136919.1 hypothetical protein [Rhizobium sp. B209b/85]MBO9172333.1 hypothetical protein [Rhizobium sp. L245/93]MBO9186506.1 hypothetical protein [Rhizobium sp. E27B/91]MBZ5763650.1 hypothetical protein [Rhizobium sp. VS19-DR96]
MESIDLKRGIGRNGLSQSFAFTSVCEAHPDVREASISLAGAMKLPLVVGATGNEVRQHGSLGVIP